MSQAAGTLCRSSHASLRADYRTARSNGSFLGGELITRLRRRMGNALLLDWSGCYTSMSICGKPQTQALGFVYFII